MNFMRKKPREPRHGLREPAVLYSQKHRKFIRGFACVVPGCDRLPIECVHVRLGLPAGESAGMAQKPSDVWCLPGCRAHHRHAIAWGDPTKGDDITSIHRNGEASFAKAYGLDLPKLCLQFALKSTDMAIRDKAKGIEL